MMMESILNNPANAQELLNMTAGTLFLLDKEGVCVDVMSTNRSNLSFFQEKDIKGKNILRLLPTSTFRYFYANFREVLTNHTLSSQNYELTLNGKTHYFYCTMQFYNGMVLCQYNDTTKHSIEEKELAKRNQELTEIQQIAMIGSWEFHSATGIIRYTGHGGVMEHNGVIDLSIGTYSSYVLPDDRKNFDEWVRRNMRGDISESVNFRIRFDNKIFYMKARTLSYERMKDGSVIAEGYAHNVTDIQKSRNDINLLTHAMDNAVEYISAADTDGNMLFGNRLFRKSLNIHEEEDITLRKIWDYPMVEDAEMWKRVCAMVKEGNFEQGFIMLNPLPLHPEVQAIEIKGFWVTDDSGQESIWMFGRDVTDMMEAAKKLKEAKEKAERSERLKSAFLANMSHEIRTPLNAIVGFSRIISEVENPEDRKEFCRIIEENNERLIQLINELLDLSKIEANMVKFNIRPVSMHEVCTEVQNAFALRCPPEVELIYEPSDTALHAIADKNRTIQVISNLVDNALKFTKHGSIRYGYRENEGAIEIHTTDTGIGIAEEKVGSVFDRFVKADENIHGTGLGLSISKMLVEKMNGQISVRSKLGKGTTFLFTLPKAL